MTNDGAEYVPAVICTLWMSDESYTSVDPEEIPRIDRAMQLWADSGHTRDTWLSLTGQSGADFSVLASVITSMQRTTVEHRRLATIMDKAHEDERAMLRRDAGFIESQP